MKVKLRLLQLFKYLFLENGSSLLYPSTFQIKFMSSGTWDSNFVHMPSLFYCCWGLPNFLDWHKLTCPYIECFVKNTKSIKIKWNWVLKKNKNKQKQKPQTWFVWFFNVTSIINFARPNQHQILDTNIHNYIYIPMRTTCRLVKWLFYHLLAQSNRV